MAALPKPRGREKQLLCAAAEAEAGFFSRREMTTMSMGSVDKAALLRNLELETTDAVRQVQMATEEALASIKQRVDAAVSMMPTKLRATTVEDFVLKFNGSVAYFQECAIAEEVASLAKEKKRTVAKDPETMRPRRIRKEPMMVRLGMSHTIVAFDAYLQHARTQLHSNANTARKPPPFNNLLPETPAIPSTTSKRSRKPRPNESFLSINGSPLVLHDDDSYADESLCQPSIYLPRRGTVKNRPGGADMSILGGLTSGSAANFTFNVPLDAGRTIVEVDPQLSPSGIQNLEPERKEEVKRQLLAAQDHLASLLMQI
ncbi:hypothetical protein BC830DRAFT_1165221 [Chytriomyces sp. MP71]|nr:hypothetical protein BC830DRAFT_1165221 [Chytriomyces sp. MP71]